MPRIGKTILVGERGHSLTAHSLGVLVSRALRAMGVAGYSIHGLRKNAAKALAEAGCSDAEIMAITGHRTNEMIPALHPSSGAAPHGATGDGQTRSPAGTETVWH